jgi:simple sugar transport system ATP-binding protein
MQKIHEVCRETQRGEILLEGKGISKGFPGVWEYLILDHVDFDVRAGEVHTLLGENGAGKTVIANILSGYYDLTSGQIYVKGEAVTLKSPRDGLAHGIGMVHQELMLVAPFTVAENVALALKVFGLSYPLREVEKRIEALSAHYQLQVHPRARVEDLSAGEQQRVEIIKVLYHEPEVLILDEPTSLLTPEEAKALFKVLRTMGDEGHGVVFITHKMKEVMEVSDRITILKLGKMMGTKLASETDEDELNRLMFGEEIIPQVEREPVKGTELALEVKDLHALSPEGIPALKGISLHITRGEILGIAGVAGNGQSELAETITGLRHATQGKVFIFGRDMTNHSPGEIIDAGVAHIPEKRRAIGVVEPMKVAENVVLKDYRKPPFSKHGILDTPAITQHTKKIVENFNALVPDLWRSPTRILSGGNIQRLILGRETWREPPILLAIHPTEGLDAKALRQTWELFMSLRDKGSAILLISEDLDEVMALSDRIAVIFEGEIVGIVEGAGATKNRIGAMMAGSEDPGAAQT